MLPTSWRAFCHLKCPQLSGSSQLPEFSSPAEHLWVLLILTYVYLALCCSWGVGQVPALGSCAAACPRVGGLTGSHGMSPEHLLRDGSKLPTRSTQEQGDFFGSHLLRPASLAWGRLTAGSQSGWGEKVNSLLPCLPARAVGLAAWLARWAVVAHGAFYLCTPWGENLPSSPVCLFLHGVNGQTGRQGTNGSFGILAKCYATYKTCLPTRQAFTQSQGEAFSPDHACAALPLGVKQGGPWP